LEDIFALGKEGVVGFCFGDFNSAGSFVLHLEQYN
jgi:hypothetical protein